MTAVKRFDPDRGVRLVSFAIHWIKAEMHEYILRNWRMVKIATTKAQRKLFFNLRSMKKTSAALTRKEIRQVAETLNVKESDVVEMEQRLGGGDVALEPAPDDGEDFAVTPIAYLTDASEGPADLFEREQTEANRSRGLADALQGLDERSRRIIQARWLAKSDPKTLHQLPAELGVSPERIRQSDSTAVEHLKRQLPSL